MVVMVLHVRGRSPVSPVRWSSVIITLLHPVLLLSLGVIILLKKRERGHELTVKYQNRVSHAAAIGNNKNYKPISLNQL